MSDMKRYAFKVLALSSLLVLLVGGIVYAQTEPRIIAKIPFAFIAGNKTFSAGEYTIDRPNSNEPDLLLIRSADRHVALFLNANNVEARQTPKKTELIFNEIGDKYFLSQIWMAGEETGREIPKPRSERELEQAALKSTPQVITVQPEMTGNQASQ
jgi:hypothetical protein